jgi:hypothetical protein
MIFYDLLLFSKYLLELNKKENDKTVFNIMCNQARDVIWMVTKIEGMKTRLLRKLKDLNRS